MRQKSSCIEYPAIGLHNFFTDNTFDPNFQQVIVQLFPFSIDRQMQPDVEEHLLLKMSKHCYMYL